MKNKTAALFVESDGVYSGINKIDPWCINRNAMLYKGPHKAICHPPCKRWGRYWGGGPSSKKKLLLGDDDNCFAHSLWVVRTFGGVIEHPEASHAYNWFGLNRPPKSGGWIVADKFGGLTCCMEQGNYGHKARKATWLYINKINPIELKWGKASNCMRIDPGFRTKEQGLIARASKDYDPIKRLSPKERIDTPIEFRDLLISMVKE